MFLASISFTSRGRLRLKKVLRRLKIWRRFLAAAVIDTALHCVCTENRQAGAACEQVFSIPIPKALLPHVRKFHAN
jgi:hypothetical protein